MQIYINCSSLAAFLSVSRQSIASLAIAVLRAILEKKDKTDKQADSWGLRGEEGTYRILIKHPLISHV